MIANTSALFLSVSPHGVSAPIGAVTSAFPGCASPSGRHRATRRDPRRRSVSDLVQEQSLIVADASGRTHLVSEDHFADGRQKGIYRALCGSTVVSGSLATPDHEWCRVCLRWSRAERCR